MNIEDIRQKYQRDASQTFAQWKDWVRKNKPSQAQAHIVKAVAPNGGNYERVFGGYTDAQNTASDLVSHGYKDVKLFSSVNAGPLKLLRKFKDSVDSVDAVDSIREKYCIDKSLSELERSYKMGLGSKEKRAMFEKVNTPEAQKKAKDRRIKREFEANVRNPSFNKNNPDSVMYKQVKNDLVQLSVALKNIEKDSFRDSGLTAAAKKIRDAVNTYSRLFEQKGKGAISVR